VKSGWPVALSAPDVATIAAAIVAARPNLDISFADKGFGPPVGGNLSQTVFVGANRPRRFD
jgi:hypothetical protein